MCPVFPPILPKSEFSRYIFIRLRSTKFHENPSGGSRAVTGQTEEKTDGRTDMKIFFVLFANTRTCLNVRNSDEKIIVAMNKYE